jgi:putative molybdopterin biosynthesis protein
MQIAQDFTIQIDNTIGTPIFKQISEQIKQAVASKTIQKGGRLPPVRQLARELGINPGTVARAYLELEQEKVVMSRRGGGTIVATKSDNPTLNRLRQRRLSNLVGNHILETLSLGYSPEELEAEFSLHLSRWREERKVSEPRELERHVDKSSVKTLVIVASHDLALNLLADKLKERNPEYNVDITYAGSLGGLIALQEGRANLAGIHLLDEETGEYNYPYLKHLMPGRELVVVNLVYRIQGLMFAHENPKHINGFNDLRRDDIRFINRQQGSGTRVLLDFELRKHGIQASEVRGYEIELNNHLAVARSISHGEADVGLGIETAAEADGLDFLPLLKERYDLVIPTENYGNMLIADLVKIMVSEEFKAIVARLGGYDTSYTGTVTFLR